MKEIYNLFMSDSWKTCQNIHVIFINNNVYEREFMPQHFRLCSSDVFINDYQREVTLIFVQRYINNSYLY